jgi:hypothetical protein
MRAAREEPGLAGPLDQARVRATPFWTRTLHKRLHATARSTKSKSTERESADVRRFCRAL